MERKIATYLIIFIVFFSAILYVAMLLSNAHKKASMIVRNQFSEQQNIFLQQTVNSIESNMRSLSRELGFLIKIPVIHNINALSAKKTMESSYNYLKELYASDFALIDDQGGIVVNLSSSLQTGRDYLSVPCLEQARTSTESIPVYQIISFPDRETGDKAIAMALPFFSQKGAFGGMLLLTVKVRDLMGGFVPEEAFRCMKCNFRAVDSYRNILYERTASARVSSSEFSVRDTSMRSLRDSSHAGREPSSGAVSAGGSGAVTITKPLHIAGQTWSVILSTPEETVNDLLSDFRSVYLVGTSAALFVIIASSASMVFLIYKGNLRLQEEIDERKRAEADLQEAHDQLEYRVKDRTAELNEINKLLEKEIEGKARIESKLREQNELIKNTLESLSHPFYVIDVSDYSIKMANAASNFRSIPGKNTCYALTHDRSTPCDDKGHPCTIKEILKTREPVILEHIHFDIRGNAQFIEVHGYPIFNGNGDVEQIIEYTLDITERKKAEDRIKASLLEKDVLLKEIHHRVKNNMQVISSLLDLQSRCIEDSQLLEMFRDSKSRIKAMALIHEQLYQSRDLTNIDFSTYIRSLVNGLITFYGTNTTHISLEIAANGINLGIDTAIPCGLIINELVSNSLKHAFPGSSAGEIRIALRTTTGGEEQYFYELIVSDDGIGIPEGLIVKDLKTLGLNVVVTLVEHQLQGSFEVRSDNGTTFIIRFNELKYKKSRYRV